MNKFIKILMILVLAFVFSGCSYEFSFKTEEKKWEEQAQSYLETLSLEQKIGQMFMVGFSGTSIPSSLITNISQYYFGNFIYFGPNVADDSLVPQLSEDIQSTIMEKTGIPGFISMDQEGGMVVRFANNATHFIGNMGLVATNKSDNSYIVGKFSGQELRHYGVNLNLAPVLDVNNNPSNPVIGIRSYSDDPKVVSAYGNMMIKGLRAGEVMATAKHFPGHGDTSVDSHYGLPQIAHSMEHLEAFELYPFQKAIDNGIDAIMSAHIIFSALDTVYPATLSKKVITDLLRDKMGFDGIVMTDSMNMDAISKNFGVAEAAVLAVNAGVDLLLYGESTTLSVLAYLGVLNAVKGGTISEDRINEAVLRILTKKAKYNLFNDYLPRVNLTNADFALHKDLSEKLIRKSITVAKGSVDQFSISKATLFISSVCTRYPLIPGYQINTTNNSFAYVANNYFKELGMVNADYEVIGTSVTSTKMATIIAKASDYEQVVIAMENASLSQSQLVKSLFAQHPDLLVVALKNPYDINNFTEINNYLCTYGYFASSVFAVFDLLMNEYEAEGIMPVYVDGLF
ncbi:MAG: glycoside hydrolase family 3 protein [Bacilli bacterium]